MDDRVSSRLEGAMRSVEPEEPEAEEEVPEEKPATDAAGEDDPF